MTAELDTNAELPALMECDQPDWFHQHGMKMRVVQVTDECVVLTAPAAKLTIMRCAPDTAGEQYYAVNWKVKLSRSEDTSGSRSFTEEQLKGAFGLTNISSWSGHSLITRYGGTSAGQGLWIRSGAHLNIPCPGTGHDGDPNISIMLDDKMRLAIRSLLTRP